MCTCSARGASPHTYHPTPTGLRPQVYAASIMFGYFLRRVDQRFQLERAIGLDVAVSRDDAVARLERLFAAADADEGVPPEELDVGPSSSSSSSTSSSASSARAESGRDASSSSSSGTAWAGAPMGSSDNLPARKQKSALRR